VKAAFPIVSAKPPDNLETESPEAYYTANTAFVNTTNARAQVSLLYQSDCGKARARFQNLFDPACLVYKTLATMAKVTDSNRHLLDAAINYFDDSYKPNSAEDAAHKLKQLERLRDSSEGFTIMKSNFIQLIEELDALDKAPTQDTIRLLIPVNITNEKFKEKVREYCALPSYMQPISPPPDYTLALDPRTPWRIFLNALEKRLDSFPEDELPQFNGIANLSDALSRKEKKRKNKSQGLSAEEDAALPKKKREKNSGKKAKSCAKCNQPNCPSTGRDCKSKTCADCQRKLEPGVYHTCAKRDKSVQRSRDDDRKSAREDTPSGRKDDRSDREERRPRRDSAPYSPERQRERERSRSRDTLRFEEPRRVAWVDRESPHREAPRRDPPRRDDRDRRSSRTYAVERENSEWDNDGSYDQEYY